jgi:hypothetical protein
MYDVETLVQPSFRHIEESDALAQFCLTAQQEIDNNAVTNVRFDGWAENTSSFLYAISRGRFDEPKGTLQTITYGGAIVAVAGAYVSDFDSEAVFVGCRSWTLPEHRAKFLLGDLILPVQFEWALAHRADVAMMSFVPYNGWLANMILRASAGRALKLGQPNSPAYMGWVAYPNLCTIKGVNQIVLYKQLGIDDRIPDLIDVDTKLPHELD